MGRPNLTFKRKELEECRAKILRYYCRERYSPGHDCRQQKRMQIFMMELTEGIKDTETSNFIYKEGESSVVKQDQVAPIISLNAMHGEVGGKWARRLYIYL